MRFRRTYDETPSGNRGDKIAHSYSGPAEWKRHLSAGNIEGMHRARWQALSAHA